MEFDNNAIPEDGFDFNSMGVPLWDIFNPLACRKINGIVFNITDENKVVNMGTPQAYKLFSAYQGFVHLGDFRCVDDAKTCAEGYAKIMYN